MNRTFSICLCLMLVAGQAFSIGPHELALIVRDGDKESLEIANLYAGLRDIPAANIVSVSLPRRSAHDMGIEEFRSRIYDAVNKTLEDRGVSEHVQAWAYSLGFPARVQVSEGLTLSLHGATYLRGSVPDKEALLRGKVNSRLFAAPSMPSGAPLPGRSLDAYARILGEAMPLCSMSLGVSGKQGNSLDEIRRCLIRARSADATAPEGTVYLYDTEDVRSVARDWQFKAARPLIESAGLNCRVLEKWSGIEPSSMGVMLGLQHVSFGDEMLEPGAFAEHLTSFAGHFEDATQTKLTEWIRRGAAASAGTVVEPRAIWMKFPHAQFYVYYASGCTMIESLFQSIRSPMEILLVGDPLVQPWKSPERLSVKGLHNVPAGDLLALTMTVSGKDRMRYNRFEVYIDGRRVGTYFDPSFEVSMPQRSVKALRDLRVVAVKSGRIRTRLTHVAE